MKNCAELKQTTVKKVIDFPKCSIEFELRGATEKEYDKMRESISNVVNNPDYTEVKLKGKLAIENDDYSIITKEESQLLEKYNKEINDAVKKGDRDLLLTCLTPNPLYNAGFKVISGSNDFKDIEEIFSFMSKPKVEELEALALKLSTLGNDEVAVDQVKQV